MINPFDSSYRLPADEAREWGSHYTRGEVCHSATVCECGQCLKPYRLCVSRKWHVPF